MQKPDKARFEIGSCPTEQALDLIASKWTVYIVYELERAGVLRFREIQRLLASITQKELTKQLRRLERFGLVVRTVYPEVPPRVEYRLSPLGASLIVPLRALSSWAVTHGAQVEEHRRKHDETQGVA